MVKLWTMARFEQSLRGLIARVVKPGAARSILISVLIIVGIVGAILLAADKPASQSPHTGSSATITPTQSKNSSEPPKQPEPAAPQSNPQAVPTVTSSTPKTPPKATGPPAPTPFVVSAVSLTGSSVCGYSQDVMGPYTHAVSYVLSVSIAPNYPGGTITWKWEYGGDYDDMDGLDSAVFTQQIQAGARQTTLSTFGDARSIDAEGLSNNFKFRAVILAPNSMVSNWISTTDC